MMLLAVLVLAGCTLKITKSPEALTGEAALTGVESTGVEVTGEEVIPTIPSSEMEEFTGEFDSGVVPTVTGSEGVSTKTGVTSDVKNLINQRATQPKDDTKLTEEDIDLMEQIINKVQDL